MQRVANHISLITISISTLLFLSPSGSLDGADRVYVCMLIICAKTILCKLPYYGQIRDGHTGELKEIEHGLQRVLGGPELGGRREQSPLLDEGLLGARLTS